MSDLTSFAASSAAPLSAVIAGSIGAIGAHLPFRGRSLLDRLHRRPRCLTVGISIVAETARPWPVETALSLCDDIGDLIDQCALHAGPALTAPTEWERSYLGDVVAAGASLGGRAFLLISVDPQSSAAAQAFFDLGQSDTWQHLIATAQHHFQCAGWGTRVLSPTEVALAATLPTRWSLHRNSRNAAVLPQFRTAIRKGCQSRSEGFQDDELSAAPQLVLGLDADGTPVCLRPRIHAVAKLISPHEVTELLIAAVLAQGWTVGIRTYRADKWRKFVHNAAGRAWFFQDSQRECDIVLIDAGAPHPAGCCVWEICEPTDSEAAQEIEHRESFAMPMDAHASTVISPTVVIQGVLWQFYSFDGVESRVTGVIPLPSLAKDVRQIRRT